jgi:hypothetical protein
VSLAIDHIQAGDDVDSHVVIGPVVWQLKGDMRQWYFVVASADEGIIRLDQMASDTKTLAQEFRDVLYVTLIQEKQPIIVHDINDELEMARLCETLWPSPKIRKIRADIEAERRSEVTG